MGLYSLTKLPFGLYTYYLVAISAYTLIIKLPFWPIQTWEMFLHYPQRAPPLDKFRNAPRGGAPLRIPPEIPHQRSLPPHNLPNISKASRRLRREVFYEKKPYSSSNSPIFGFLTGAYWHRGEEETCERRRVGAGKIGLTEMVEPDTNHGYKGK